MLTDPPIRDWWRFPIRPEVSLNFSGRGDLCVNAEFFEEYAANTLDEALGKFLGADMRSCPLVYRFHYASKARPFDAWVGAFLLDFDGSLVRNPPHCADPDECDEAEEGNTLFVLSAEDTGEGKCEVFEDEDGVQEFRDFDYAPFLTVGGENEEQAEARWFDLADHLRGRLRVLRAGGGPDLKKIVTRGKARKLAEAYGS